MSSMTLIDGMPCLIQAGMGIHVSSARLANATSRLGALGVGRGLAAHRGRRYSWRR